jgi:hypothetical protein
MVGPLTIDHAVMADAIDISWNALRWDVSASPLAGITPAEARALGGLLARAEASHDGMLRGHRHACSMIPTSLLLGRRVHSCAARWRGLWDMPRFTYPVVPSIRGRTAADRSR